jgi:hypothetical protein
VFEDDLEIKIFLEMVDEFSALHIDQDFNSEIHPHPDVFLNKICDHHIVQLPNNHIPKDLVPLEILFERNHLAIKGKVPNEDVDVAKCNIGTEGNPNFFKLSNSFSKEQRVVYAELLREFFDVFSWTYEDLRSYELSFIEHNIPLKEESKLFRQKLRQINPMLLHVMEKEVKSCWMPRSSCLRGILSGWPTWSQ